MPDLVPVRRRIVPVSQTSASQERSSATTASTTHVYKITGSFTIPTESILLLDVRGKFRNAVAHHLHLVPAVYIYNAVSGSRQRLRRRGRHRKSHSITRRTRSSTTPENETAYSSRLLTARPIPSHPPIHPISAAAASSTHAKKLICTYLNSPVCTEWRDENEDPYSQ